MCGIVGAASTRNVVPILIDGIRRLEYRGYDSSGVAVIEDGVLPHLERLVSTARVADLASQAQARQLAGITGISHTRWATHGAPTPANAHPHVSGGEIAVVHNGIIENYEALREQLQARGYEFATQTDTEVIAHLVHAHWHGAGGGDLLRAVQAAVAEFHGAYAIAVISTREPGRVVGARQGSPLVVGIGADDHFLASDAAALLSVTRRVAYLEEGDVADVRRDGYAIHDARGERVVRTVVTVEASAAAIELGPYRHFMQKEIFEQPRAVADTLESVSSIGPEIFGREAEKILAGIDSVLILACGTSHYSSLVARQWLESVARIPCVVEIASEYRYRDSVPNPNALVIVVSQSGETADTLAALRHAKELGHTRTLAICNVATSSMVRQTALTFLTRAGVEVGVASTKAFTTQLIALFLLTLTLAKLRGRLTADEEAHCPRRSLSGRGTQARPAGARRCGDAGGRDRAQRRAARQAQEQPAGSPCAGRRALRRRRPRQPAHVEREHPRDPAAGACRPPVADRAHDSAAASRVSRRGDPWYRRRQAAQPREVGDGGVSVLSMALI